MLSVVVCDKENNPVTNKYCGCFLREILNLLEKTASLNHGSRVSQPISDAHSARYVWNVGVASHLLCVNLSLDARTRTLTKTSLTRSAHGQVSGSLGTHPHGDMH